ncbi:hypothetical protein NI18_13320 [Sphingomonas sp. Ant20]|nr:hypothetical protein NI18_13320 [Sphingomonas sp. Ant20]
MVVVIVLATVVAACAEERKPGATTEQEIHSRDSETPSGVRGRHLYACDDGEPLFVDFKDEGLSIELRRVERETPRVLSAPAQGLQYVGDSESAIMTGNELRLVDAQGLKRVCRKQN